ncbi:FAD-binding domain-containing protein, partial [Setomelanomma holmii]
PNSQCWPSEAEWASLNKTLGGALIRGVAPGSVCYPDQPNYNPDACAFVASQWFNSTWHATNPVSIDYPIWTNNSCNPICPNGTSIIGDPGAGARGCSMGAYPAFVVNATTPKDVGAALKWAGERNICVVVKSTGHSYPGRSIGYGSLSIWTHNFRGIEYIKAFKPTSCTANATFQAARVAAGHTGIEVQSELAKHNAVIVTGAYPDVGLVGWLTGGGHGDLSATYGMCADNHLEATIVTADGNVLVANPCKNADIFFAIRGGGGGTYGVVTEMIVRAYPTPMTTSHTLRLMSLSTNTSTEYYDFIGFLHAEMPQLKAGGMHGYYFTAGPPIGFNLYDKPNGTVERLVAPVQKYLDAQGHLFAYEQSITYADTYFDTYKDTTNEVVANGGSAYGSRLLSPDSLANANVTAKVFAQIGPSADASKPNPIVLGHMIASPVTPSYYPNTISMNPAWRNTLTSLIVVSPFPDGIPQSFIDAVYHDITHNKTEALRQLSPDTGAYFNEADSYEPEWQQAFFGKNYQKLLGIRRKYDPWNMLWCRRCVGSEALVEQSDGRLCKTRTTKRTYDSEGGRRFSRDQIVNKARREIVAEDMERANEMVSVVVG